MCLIKTYVLMFFCRKNSKRIAHNVLLSKKHNPCTIKILYKTIFQYKSSWKAENAQLGKYYFPVGQLFFFSWKIIFSQLGLFLPPFLSVFAHFDQLWLILLTANKSLQFFRRDNSGCLIIKCHLIPAKIRWH